MTEQLCDFHTCQLARQKGFNEICKEVWILMKEGPVAGKDLFAYDINKPQVMRELADEFMVSSPCKNSHLSGRIFARPTQDLLERWLREMHHIVITIKYYVGPGYYYADLGIISRALSEDGVPGAPFHTFELAREAAIVHALKLLPDAQG